MECWKTCEHAIITMTHNDVNCAQENGVLKHLWTSNNHNDFNCAQDNGVLKNLWTHNNHNDSQWR